MLYSDNDLVKAVNSMLIELVGFLGNSYND